MTEIAGAVINIQQYLQAAMLADNIDDRLNDLYEAVDVLEGLLSISHDDYQEEYGEEYDR